MLQTATFRERQMNSITFFFCYMNYIPFPNAIRNAGKSIFPHPYARYYTVRQDVNIKQNQRRARGGFGQIWSWDFDYFGTVEHQWTLQSQSLDIWIYLKHANMRGNSTANHKAQSNQNLQSSELGFSYKRPPKDTRPFNTSCKHLKHQIPIRS